jgi:mannose/fructose/N-acetylgalactosamine-specific phosphotransferase system component IIC
MAVALGFALLWGYAPSWNFYLTLILGFGVAEAMAWAAKGKRGSDLQVLAIAIVAGGLVLGRVILANRLGVSWTEIQNGPSGIRENMYLEFLPDGLWAAMAALIVWYRFR